MLKVARATRGRFFCLSKQATLGVNAQNARYARSRVR